MKRTQEKDKDNQIVYSEGLSNFLTYIRDCEQQYKIADSEEIECNAITQDILHFLEIEEHPYHEYARLAKKQKEIRLRRRKAKDIKVQLSPLIQWVKDNQSIIKNLETTLGEFRKAEKHNNGFKVYTPRTNEIINSNLQQEKRQGIERYGN